MKQPLEVPSVSWITRPAPWRIRKLGTLPVRERSQELMSASTAQLASRHGLTLYDAAYLELAKRRGLPLATLGRELRSAASAEGVILLGK